MSTHFTFLAAEWQSVFESASKAESLVHPDPQSACFYARRALETAMAWLYTDDGKLKLTSHGAMRPELLYESPFTDLNPQGPEGVFAPAQVETLISLLGKIRDRTVA
jgi:hypothetical protein